VLIERYKSVLNRQNDLTKIFIPQIVELLGDSERLYNDGVSVIAELENQFRAFSQWAEKLYKAQFKADPYISSMPKGPESREAQLQRPDGSYITFSELLAESAPDDSIRSLVQTDNFWTHKSQYEWGSGFLAQLYVCYQLRNNPQMEKAEGVALLQAAYPGLLQSVAFLFAEFVVSPRASYLDSVKKFRLKVMRTLEPRTRRQEKVFNNITDLLTYAQKTIESYPKGERHRNKRKTGT
jgi:hypothetical protein